MTDRISLIAAKGATYIIQNPLSVDGLKIEITAVGRKLKVRASCSGRIQTLWIPNEDGFTIESR